MATKRKNPAMAIDWLLQLAKRADNGWDASVQLTAVQVLKDAEVHRQLSKLFEELEAHLGHTSAQEKLVEFLDNCCCMTGVVLTQASDGRFANQATRTQKNDDLKALKADIKALRKKLTSLASPLGSAVSLEYLNARHAAGNPPGYSKLRRPSLRLDNKSFDMASTLQSILEVLEDEVQEVSADIQRSIRRARQTKGKDPTAASMVKAVGRAFNNLESELPCPLNGKNPTTMAIASAILIAFNLPGTLSESTVRSQLRKL